jgi:hypothetical protein
MFETELHQVAAFMANHNPDAAAQLLDLLNAELDALEQQLEPEIQVHAVSH